MVLVSLCMIAKNEARFLAQCLRSVRDLVGEIVLVDTGSTDETVAIGESFGARVLHEPWNDDFATPRNRALAAATGKFVLQLDADEVLAQGAVAALRAALIRDDFECALLPLHNARTLEAAPGEVVSGSARLGEVMHLPRLFRRLEGLRYEGAIHESFTRGLVEARGRIVFVDAPLVHYGATETVVRDRGKSARNLRLLDRRIAEDPSDHVARGYRVAELLEAGRAEEAWAESEVAWSQVTSTPKEAHLSVHRLAVFRALLQQRRGDASGCLETLARAEICEGPHPDYDFLRAIAHELLALGCSEGSRGRLRHLREAMSAQRAAISRSSTRYAQRFVTGAAGSASQERIAVLALLLGEPEAARQAVQAAAPQAGEESLTLRMIRVEVELTFGDPALALAQVLTCLASEPEEPDVWTLAALACEAAGLLDDASGLCRRARLRLGRGFLAPHRKHELLALVGRLAAYQGRPVSGPGIDGALGALAARKPFDVAASLGASAPTRVVERFVLGLLRAGQAALLEPLLSKRAQHALPGVGAAVHEALAKVGARIDDDGQPMPIVVVADVGADAEYVAAMLRAHVEQLAEEHRPAHPVVATTTADARGVLCGTPFATLLTVDDAMVDPPAEFSGRTVGVDVDGLLRDPLPALGTLLAELDLASGPGALRYLVESYPGTRRAPAQRVKTSFVRSRA